MPYTVPIAKTISVKNERAWISMDSYLKKLKLDRNIKEKKNPGSRLGKIWLDGLAVLFRRRED